VAIDEKKESKKYYRHSGYMGSLKVENFQDLLKSRGINITMQEAEVLGKELSDFINFSLFSDKYFSKRFTCMNSNNTNNKECIVQNCRDRIHSNAQIYFA